MLFSAMIQPPGLRNTMKVKQHMRDAMQKCLDMQWVPACMIHK